MAGKTILVVDDEPDFIHTISERLRFEGYAVHGASDAAEARAKIEEVHPDLIILDVMMPGMDGIQLFRVLRSRPATAAIPVIFVSVRGDALEGAALGVDQRCRVLPKPFEMDALLLAVQEFLSGA